VLENNPKEVKLVHKNFPLSKHRYAIKAASAALAANKQGKFWEFHERLFENYKNLNDTKIQEIAKELALDMDRFNKDMKDPAIQKLIFRDIKDAREAGVRGIPTVFIGGKLLKSRRGLRVFQQMIDAELKKSR
jgi:protein-disulfide isomerase